MMTKTTVKTANSPTFLSEIFTLTLNNSCLDCFKLNHEIDREIGNRFSWRLSRQFPYVVVIFEDHCFWILAKDTKSLPSKQEWKKALLDIQEVLREDIGDRYYSIHWLKEFQITPLIIAQLAIRILKIFCRFSQPIVFPKDKETDIEITDNKVQVRREVDCWAETIDLLNQTNSLKETHPAICLTVDSSMVYSGDLEQFYETHPYRQDIEKLLVGLKVRDIETNGKAKIVKIAGTIGERKAELLEKATGSISRRKLEESDPNQPVVVVKFGKKNKEYPYPLAALRPCVTDVTQNVFQVSYGELLKETKISYAERQELLQLYKQEAQKTLTIFGLKLGERNINSREYPDLFWTPDISLNQTPILFGKGVRGEKGAILKGLSKGGVYKRHSNYLDSSYKIRLAILKPSDFRVGEFREKLQSKLKSYQFESILPNENKSNFSVEGSGVETRASIVLARIL